MGHINHWSETGLRVPRVRSALVIQAITATEAEETLGGIGPQVYLIAAQTCPEEVAVVVASREEEEAVEVAVVVDVK